MSPDPRDFRLRVMVSPDIPIGPGKADLLQGIRDTGSIAAAGRRMGMSYKRAWYLVEAVKGGRAGGGARLTPLGENVLDAFREMETLAGKAIAPALRRLRRKVSAS